MEVQFEPDVQAKLDRMARESGRAAAELVRDVVAGYFDELAGTREMLNSRYDDIKSGTAAQRHSEAHPRRRGVRPPARKERSSEGKVRFMTGYDFHPEAETALNEI